MCASVQTIPEKLPMWRTERGSFGAARLRCASSRVAERCAISDKSLSLTSLLCNYASATQLSLGCWSERTKERERENHPFLLARPPVDVRGSRKHERSRSLSLSLRYAGRILRGLHADSKKLLLHRHPPIYSKKSHTVTFWRSRSSHMWSEGSRLSFVAVLQTNIKAWVEFKGW